MTTVNRNINGTNIPSAATYSVDDTAEILGVCPMTVYRNIAKGDINASKVGRVYRITHKTLNDLIGL
tara:strand:- start:2823 stop:3023 length:201 start_codon:yes stop_codon:yes gene_type:complete